MRVIARVERQRRRARRHHKSDASCPVVSHHVSVTGLRPHTKAFSQEARDALGIAVMRAREAAGHPFRPTFAEAAGIGKTSLYKLESGIAVSASVYEAAARVLPNWTEDTPRLILEGEPPPPTTPIEVPAPDDAADESAVDHTEWSEEDEQRYQLLKGMLRTQGLEMTPHTLRIMKEEYDRLAADQRASEQATQGEHS